MPTYLFDTKPRSKHEIQQLINYYYRKGGGTYSGAAQAYAQENNTSISAFNELVRLRDYYNAHPEEEPEPALSKPLEVYTLKEIQDIINYYYQKGNGTYEGAARSFPSGPDAFNQLVAYRNYLQKNPDKAPKYPISDEQYQKITKIVNDTKQKIITNEYEVAHADKLYVNPKIITNNIKEQQVQPLSDLNNYQASINLFGKNNRAPYVSAEAVSTKVYPAYYVNPNITRISRRYND